MDFDILTKYLTKMMQLLPVFFGYTEDEQSQKYSLSINFECV